jgi:hypothetical protein
VDAAKAAAKAKLDSERAQAPSLRGVVSAYVAFVKASFGNAPAVLVDFGLSPRKARTPQTAEQKAVASAKRKATRAARHVMGPKQRKAVTAPVQVTLTTTPLAAPRPIAEPPAPAAPAPSGVAPGGTAPAGTAPTAGTAPAGNAPTAGTAPNPGATTGGATPHT